MSLLRCKVCGESVSVRAAKCPHCEALNPTGTSVVSRLWKPLVVLFGVLALVVAIFLVLNYVMLQ